MFLSVKELELGKLRFDTSFKPGQIDFFDDRLRQREPISVSGAAELMDSLGEIRVHGQIAGRLDTDCDRCLEPIALQLDGPFDLYYRPAGDDSEPSADEVEISGDDTEIGFYEGLGLPLGDVVREQILLSLPMQRVCSHDCKGICPSCGRNRNVSSCDCRLAPADERWAALKKLTGD